MTVGPKGQVVIPKVLRDEYGITPKGKVVLKEIKEGILLSKTKIDAVSIFRLIAKSGKQAKRKDIHFYERELEERWLKAKPK